MDKYYYLVAQLPLLFFDRAPQITTEAYDREVQKWLSAETYNDLIRLKTGQSPNQCPPTLINYFDFERNLKEDITGWRQAKRQGSPYRFLHIAPSVLETGTPLEIEMRLLQLHWQKLEALQVGHHFDLTFLMIYTLKLNILHRRFAFDKPKGLATFRAQCEVAL